MSRVGAAGGGKSYRKSRPSNYYGALAVIVVLGLALVVYSRYEYQNPVKVHNHVVQPAVGTTSYAGVSVQVCGKSLPYLAPDPANRASYLIENADVIKVSPIATSDAGHHATFAGFIGETPGYVATATKLAIPTAAGKANPATTFTNGQSCPAKSKYPGQKGKVVYAYWSSFAQKSPTLTTNPSSIHFVKELRVTMAFEPAGVTPRAPSAATTDQMVLATTTPTTTTTIAITPPTTTPTSPTTTSVPSGGATTTSPSTTTPSTTKPTTTTTTKG